MARTRRERKRNIERRIDWRQVFRSSFAYCSLKITITSEWKEFEKRSAWVETINLKITSFLIQQKKKLWLMGILSISFCMLFSPSQRKFTCMLIVLKKTVAIIEVSLVNNIFFTHRDSWKWLYSLKGWPAVRSPSHRMRPFYSEAFAHDWEGQWCKNCSQFIKRKRDGPTDWPVDSFIHFCKICI